MLDVDCQIMEWEPQNVPSALCAAYHFLPSYIFYSAVGDQYEVSAKIENMVKIRQMEILHPSPLTVRLQKVINTPKFAIKCSYRRILKSS